MAQNNKKKTLKRLTIRSLKANKTRNCVAVIAIALTTILFTALFSIMASLNKSFEEQTFRQVGGRFHASFKDIDKELADTIAKDSLISESGLRYFLGFASDVPFQKSQVEVSYMDKIEATKDFYCKPEHGGLPAEQVDDSKLPQLATDTKVLKLLGITPEIGAVVPITYELGNGEKITQEFSLSGWWEADEAALANMILVSRSYCDTVLENYVSEEFDSTGKWTLNVMFSNSMDIEGNVQKVLEHQNLQDDDVLQDAYVATGVNWAYTSTQMVENIDPFSVAMVVIVLLLIIVTGYLIINNIFRISVIYDIQFYGLLKTIGTTGKQLKKIIFRQAFLLSAIGIPIGLVLGFVMGNVLTPVIMNTLNCTVCVISVQPLLFIGATVFALVTVFISCMKPAKMASKVSPVEAVKYTEVSTVSKKKKHSRNGAKVSRMAWANLGRNKMQTGRVVLSLVLAAVLLNSTFVISNGFDMDKYTSTFRVSDILLGGAKYFHNSVDISYDDMLEDEVIAEIDKQEGIKKSGRVYGMLEPVCAEYSKEQFTSFYKSNGWGDGLENDLASQEGDTIASGIDLYGMDDYPLTFAEVIEGDVSKVNEKDSNYIIEVVTMDGSEETADGYSELDVHKIGDKLTVTYGDKIEWYDTRTGETFDGDIPTEYIGKREGDYWEKTYTICAKVRLPYSVSYRYYGAMQYILGSETFKKDTKQDTCMLYLLDMDDKYEAAMNEFIKDYTTNVQPMYDYESKMTYQNEFHQMQQMFVIVGGALAFIIGLVGLLNFINAMLTGIHTRKREFAMMQAVGMTGVQLKKMLVMEGIFYTTISIALATLLTLVFNPALSKLLCNLFWFFSPYMTVVPLVIIFPVYIVAGAVVPFVIYRKLEKSSIIERLRVVE